MHNGSKIITKIPLRIFSGRDSSLDPPNVRVSESLKVTILKRAIIVWNNLRSSITGYLPDLHNSLTETSSKLCRSRSEFAGCSSTPTFLLRVKVSCSGGKSIGHRPTQRFNEFFIQPKLSLAISTYFVSHADDIDPFLCAVSHAFLLEIISNFN